MSADEGEKLFRARCSQCHTTAKDAPNKLGPNLYGLFGRKAGAVPEYKFTQAMKNSGVTWEHDTLFEFLESPKKFVPQNKMPFPGFKREQDRDNVIAFLKQATRKGKDGMWINYVVSVLGVVGFLLYWNWKRSPQ
eukprot:TRINITY_DN11077_c0_g1_i1.p1 TRINITY_DN11077_c0_g1~~TRINITY_DN11077_c0_g1_i1.p1  ORF type:complete len:135 (-),score=39.68 TRINITY_DN11077_c0_g1_i1:8-412(-)